MHSLYISCETGRVKIWCIIAENIICLLSGPVKSSLGLFPEVNTSLHICNVSLKLFRCKSTRFIGASAKSQHGSYMSWINYGPSRALLRLSTIPYRLNVINNYIYLFNIFIQAGSRKNNCVYCLWTITHDGFTALCNCKSDLIDRCGNDFNCSIKLNIVCKTTSRLFSFIKTWRFCDCATDSLNCNMNGREGKFSYFHTIEPFN